MLVVHANKKAELTRVTTERMQTSATLRHRKEQVQKAEGEHQEAVGVLEGEKEALAVLHLKSLVY